METATKPAILWLAVIGLAALLRLGPIASGLPYIDYIDEGHVLHPAIGILKSQVADSRLYTYPPLTSYLLVGAAKIYAPVYRALHHRKLRDDLPSDRDLHTELGDQYDLITPPEIIVLGRLVIAGLSLGTVLLAGAVGRMLGGARAGILAALWVALCPALVARSSIVIIDTTAAFFVMAAIYFCQRLRHAAESKPSSLKIGALLAGVSSGLAFGGKYTAGLVFAAVLATAATLPIPTRSKGALGLLAGVGLLAGLFLGVPTVLLHPDRIIAELRSQAAFYQTIRSDQNYWSAALATWEIGLPLAGAGIAGIIWMLCDRNTRLAAVSWLAFVVPFLAAVAWSSFQPFRNLLPIVPLICIAAALLCDRVTDRIDRSDRPLLAWLSPALILALAISLGWGGTEYLRSRTNRIDSRVQAVNWLQAHATKEQTILGLSELSILPAEWKRVPAQVTVVPWLEAADLLDRQRFDYVMTGELDLRHVGDPQRWSAYSERWRTVTSNMKSPANFGTVVTPVVPYLWRTNDQRILILAP
jgi:hypothetical protein